MAYYIIYFNNYGSVINVIRFDESEYEEYKNKISEAVQKDQEIQYGYY